MKTTYTILAGLTLLANGLRAQGTLETDFVTPPEATRPRCYWYWMDGNISKEGITKDLEAMKRVGIGEGYIGVISGQSGATPNPDPKALTDPWWGYIEHAIREGSRLGVDIGVFNSPGWSQSGGPWVKPSQAMRHVALPETRLHGPQHFEGKLPAPAGDFQDLAVLAFPLPAGEDELAKITTRTPTTVSFAMPAPFTARSLTVRPPAAINVAAELQASDDGKQYRSVKKFTLDRHNLAVNVGPVPLDLRRLSIWVSPEDLVQLFRIGLDHPDIRYEILYGVSDNQASWWDNSRARQLGYRPTGKAEDHRAHATAEQAKIGPDPVGDLFQGGSFCSAEFTNDVKRAGP